MVNSELISDHRSGWSGVPLAEVDLAILRELSSDARISNKDLAQKVGLAPSTCSGRVQSLRNRGVIEGFSVDIDFELLGLHVFGMVSVRLTPLGRSQLRDVIDRLLSVAATFEVFQVSGERDLLVHIAADHPQGLNRFIEDHLSDPMIAHTQTSLVFDHRRAGEWSPSLAAGGSQTGSPST
ncbi:Lrp/AsnC family transcriptional regulator [Brevibacterium aurantiacum]|uniref:Lrp/AsnC family transcriptional regulator n=1 Tax=Brevibacterium aurantiacum TaxID=273384 RepID=A0A4Z0KIG4_BREAU|nr:Lrp/AsnC family transcriptional regulator [Brevibacterium aurantiacum]